MKQLIIIEIEGLKPILGEEINCLTEQEAKELGMCGQIVQIRRIDNLAIENYANNWRPATFMDLHQYFIKKNSK